MEDDSSFLEYEMGFDGERGKERRMKKRIW
jgi:hypothetical protein